MLLEGELVFQIREGIPGVTSAEERADIISQRILAIANTPDIATDDIRADVTNTQSVTIPNASVLNNNVTNYSAICRESHGYLLLHTTITLGYDVP